MPLPFNRRTFFKITGAVGLEIGASEVLSACQSPVPSPTLPDTSTEKTHTREEDIQKLTDWSRGRLLNILRAGNAEPHLNTPTLFGNIEIYHYGTDRNQLPSIEEVQRLALRLQKEVNLPEEDLARLSRKKIVILSATSKQPHDPQYDLNPFADITLFHRFLTTDYALGHIQKKYPDALNIDHSSTIPSSYDPSNQRGGGLGFNFPSSFFASEDTTSRDSTNRNPIIGDTIPVIMTGPVEGASQLFITPTGEETVLHMAFEPETVESRLGLVPNYREFNKVVLTSVMMDVIERNVNPDLLYDPQDMVFQTVIDECGVRPITKTQLYELNSQTN